MTFDPVFMSAISMCDGSVKFCNTRSKVPATFNVSFTQICSQYSGITRYPCVRNASRTACTSSTCAAGLLIIPGFATDIFGFFLIFPISRNFLLEKFFYKFKKGENETEKKKFIDGEFEDIEDDDDLIKLKKI